MKGARTSIPPAEAAKLVGRAKSTILKAIRNGRISAKKNDSGEWQIEPVELFRAYAPAERSARNSTPEVSAVPHSIPHSHEAENRFLREQLEDLRADRDAWREQAQRLALSDQRETSKPRGLLVRLFKPSNGGEYD